MRPSQSRDQFTVEGALPLVTVMRLNLAHSVSDVCQSVFKSESSGVEGSLASLASGRISEIQADGTSLAEPSYPQETLSQAASSSSGRAPRFGPRVMERVRGGPAARLETHNCAGLQSCSAPRPDARLGRKRRRSKPTARQHRTPVMAAATASTPGACSPEASRARNSKATSLSTETLLSGAVRRRWLSPSMSGFDSAHSWGGGSMQLPTRWELCGTLASRGCTRHVGQQPGGCAQRCVVLRVGSLISRQ
eukprot:scaffold6905_cov62-Phaeocystis_antarctica.AAC.3